MIVQTTGPALGWGDGLSVGWLVTCATLFAWCFTALRARDTGLPNEHGASFVFGSRRMMRGFARVGIVLSTLLFAVNAMLLAS